MNKITDSQIAAFRAEAAAAGDFDGTAIADRALDRLDRESKIADADAVSRALVMDVSQARAYCARWIADASAQQ